MPVEPLPAGALVRRSDPAALGFATTADLPPTEGVVGQERASEAVAFAIEMERSGYNLFALGPEGIGKSTLVRDALERRAAGEPVPSDWVYVHNFERPNQPRAIGLPAGRGGALRDRMSRLTSELRQTIPAASPSSARRMRQA